ncbi:MAG: STAS domain-containing protein [Bdellovibrionaceae bacterium]|nr:STAS domain-containing protein [Pseudobdellovibrionaceae bacterium]
MEAKFYQTGEVTIVAIKGRLEIEKTQAFRHACQVSLKGKKVIFCMKELNFVGSTGIHSFFQIIREFSTNNVHRAKVAELKPDFQRLWRSSDSGTVEIHESVSAALQSFQMPSMEIKE